MKYHKQETMWTCWPACVKMIFSKFGKDFSEDFLINELKVNREIWATTENMIAFFEKNKLNFVYKTNGSLDEMNTYLDTHIILVRYHLLKEKLDHYAFYMWIKDNRIHLWDPRYGTNHTYSINYFNRNRKSTREGYEKWFIAIKKV